jgi:hypothetical protein
VSSLYVVGVDPGLTTGVFAVEWFDGEHAGLRSDPIAVQVHGSEGVITIVSALLARRPLAEHVLAVEQFVVGARASRSSSAHAGRVTRALISELGELGADVFTRSAAMVKPWATDQRLHAAGLLLATKGMGHARDASRHALYAAVHMGAAQDPLSKKAVSR